MKNTDNTSNNGGPAFPHRGFLSTIKDCNGNRLEIVNAASAGMTLRDYFAAAALQGLCACSARTEPSTVSGTADLSYRIADAMLKARGGAK